MCIYTFSTHSIQFVLHIYVYHSFILTKKKYTHEKKIKGKKMKISINSSHDYTYQFYHLSENEMEKINKIKTHAIAIVAITNGKQFEKELK